MTEKSEKSIGSSDSPISNDTAKLYDSAAVENVNEAVVVLLHAALLESGFSPKGVQEEEKYCCMPENWNKNGGFQMKYAHRCCTEFTCCVTCVPLYSNVSVHGIVCDIECSDSINLRMNIKSYLKKEPDFSDVFKVVTNLKELSRHFKDNFCLPLLNLLHETIGRSPLCGMPGLVDELKVYILQLLPVEDVISMSAVNKSFNSLTNSPIVWKHLYLKDFVKGGVPDIDTSSSETNWKQIYKREYMKKKRKTKRPFMYPRYPLPQRFFSIIPDDETNIEIHFDPVFPEIYPPFMHPRYPPYFRR